MTVETTDHQLPRGPIRDSITHPDFKRALRKLLCGTKFRLLDLGCSGGGLIRSFLQEGVEFIGIEGSDHPRRMGLGEWNRCPLLLLTCDITESSQLEFATNEIVHFVVIKAWEVLEHIPEGRLLGLISNLVHHLRP